MGFSTYGNTRSTSARIVAASIVMVLKLCFGCGDPIPQLEKDSLALTGRTSRSFHCGPHPDVLFKTCNMNIQKALPFFPVKDMAAKIFRNGARPLPIYMRERGMRAVISKPGCLLMAFNRPFFILLYALAFEIYASQHMERLSIPSVGRFFQPGNHGLDINRSTGSGRFQAKNCKRLHGTGVPLICRRRKPPNSFLHVRFTTEIGHQHGPDCKLGNRQAPLSRGEKVLPGRLGIGLHISVQADSVCQHEAA